MKTRYLFIVSAVLSSCHFSGVLHVSLEFSGALPLAVFMLPLVGARKGKTSA